MKGVSVIYIKDHKRLQTTNIQRAAHAQHSMTLKQSQT